MIKVRNPANHTHTMQLRIFLQRGVELKHKNL